MTAMNKLAEDVNQKAQSVLTLTTNAENIAQEALTTANNTDNHLAGLDNQMRTLEAAMANVSIDPDDLGLEQDPDTYYVYPTYKGMRSENGIPLVGGTGTGGGGGAETIKAILSVENTSGWLSKTIASGASVTASFLWSSVEDGMATGDGSVRITVNDVVRSTRQISQGNVSVDLTPYLSTGTNKVKVRISDIYDQGRTISFNITSLELSIESSFDATTQYTGPFVFPYTPKGAIEKTVHFVIDGVERFTQVTSVSNRQMSQSIPAQSHGGHSLRVYFDAEINGELVRSNELYFEFISVERGVYDVIITSNFSKTEVDQFSAVPITFTVFDPSSQTSEVRLYANNVLISTQTVDQSEQSYTYIANREGACTIRIESGSTVKTLNFTVRESDLNIQAETENLALYLTAQGRSNNEETRNQWISNDVAAVLSDFTWRLDGWQTDEDSINVLRVSDDARVTIPYQIFARDFKTTGKTIEIEFATRDVANYSAEIISCFADNIGLKITPQQIIFRGAQNEISALYKDNEHIRLSIVVEKQNDNRLIMVYINGVMSGAIQYASGERFSQLNPVGITIGSEDCVVDIYNIRVYDNNLNRQQIVNNWIADTQNGTVRQQRYSHNNVYDAYGNITIANLPGDLPYMIIEAEELPQYKGDKKTEISGSYTDPLHPGKSFTFTGVEMDVQGTSSAVYYRKNYDMKFKQGFITPGGTTIERYGLRTNSIPFNRFVLKADVASSESANNTELTMFYNDTCPYKTPEMVANPKVRWGIEGVPIVLFWHDTTTQETQFMGKYNFNLPKRMPEPLGYSGDMESWEWERNNSPNVKFQDNDFESQMWDEVKQTYYPSWYDDFEARFPSDEWRDYSKLNEFLSWVKSTWRTAATNEDLESSVSFRVNTRSPADLYPSDNSYTVVEETSGGNRTGYYNFTFTKDTPAYRLTKFRAELSNYVELESATFYYLFTELFLMIDSRAKNMFVGFHGSDISDPNRAMDRKAVFEPYDMDTAIGTNNSGVLMFGYYLEDTDHVSSIISGGDSGGTDAPVYNAQDSALWENFRDAFRDQCVAMYRQLRTTGGWSYDAIESRFEEHQAKWPEAIFNEDSHIKYLVPLVDPVTIDEATGQLVRTDRYLTMLQGSKEEQRKWWLWNRFRYLDSKYHIGSAIANTAFIRVFNSGTLRLTSAVDMYMGVAFGGGTTPVIKRATANTPLDYPYEMPTGVTEMETWIFSADLITDIGDISRLYANEVTLTNATRLKRLQIGSGDTGYSNANLHTLNVQNSVLLEYIDVRNCPNLATTINLSNANRLTEAYFDGTAITGVDLPDGGALETLHLPGTITALVLMNLNKLTDLTCPSYANVTRLMLTNIDQSVIDPIDLLNEIPERAQINLQGFDYTMSTADEIREFLALLDTMTGVSREKGSNGEWLYHEYSDCKTTVSGTIHIDSLTGAEMKEFKDAYPYISIDARHTSSFLTYMNYDGSSTLKTVTCLNGVPQDTAPSGPARTSTAKYSFTFAGWSKNQDADTADPTATTNVAEDRTVYAAYTKTIRTYTVTWKNADGTTLETDTNVPYDTMPHYDGTTPTYQGQTSQGWTPAVAKVTGNVTYTAAYIPNYTVTFALAAEDGGTTLGTATVQQGSNATYTGETPVSSRGTAEELVFQGWSPVPNNVQGNMTVYATFQDNRSRVVKYLSKSLDVYESSDVSTVPTYAFYNQTKLTTVDLKGATVLSIAANAFNGCSALTHLIIRSTTMTTLANANALTGTKIANGFGAVYVPSDLVATYKANSVWKNFFIASIDDYPLSEFGTIQDSWSEILAAEEDGSYSTKYALGDTKQINVNGVGCFAQIVGFDKDTLTAGGTAKISWVLRDILTTHNMNSDNSTTNGWEAIEMRTWIRGTLFPTMSSDLQNAIKAVDKTFYDTTSASTKTVSDTLWIPSAREMYGGSSLGGVPHEDSGCDYTAFFSSATSKKKNYYSGTFSYWWLRSRNSNAFRCVNNNNGNISNSSMSNIHGVVLGFCT